MHGYKWQIILYDDTLESKFKVGDLVSLSADATLNFDTRNIERNKVGIVLNIRWFRKESFHWDKPRKESICEVEVLWSPSGETTFEREDRLTGVN